MYNLPNSICLPHQAVLVGTWVLFLSISGLSQSGCTFEAAANYDPLAVTDDGSCEYLTNCDYDGPLVVNFTRPDLVDWFLEENQDRIMDNVWIARQNQQGLFNAFDQVEWPGTTVGGPTNTEWKQEFTTVTGTYTSWITAADNMPSVNCNNDTEWALHILDDDIYFDVIWHSFSGGGPGGGFNYTRTLNVELSGCTLVSVVYGCLDETASNFDPAAEHDPFDTCLYGNLGCTDPMACNYDSESNADDGSCVVVGCTDPNAANYLANATADDGSCFLFDCAYKGPETYTYTKTDYADWTLEENQDRITDNVWLTRQDNQGLYNAFDQAGWPGGDVGGPSNTAWYLGTLDDTGVYTNWVTAADNNPAVNCNNDTEWALHIIAEDLYFDVVWHQWTSGNNGGGFSYSRTLDAVLSNCPTAPLVYGCTDLEAVNYESNANLDDGSCVPPEIMDDFCPADLDGSGQVGTGDVLQILGAFGTSCE